MADTVGNAAIGSVLSIDDGFLKKLEAIDNKIKDIQRSSSEMTKSVDGNFKMLATGGADAFLRKLAEISSAMDGIGNGVGKIASSGFGTATSAATGFGTSVAGVASQVDRVAAQLRTVGGDGAGALMSARANAEQFANAMKGFDTTSIAKLKENIKSLSEDLANNDYPKNIQQQKVEILKLLQEELRVAMMTQAKREANQQQSLDRMIKAEEAYQKRLAAQQKKNVTYEGALSFAGTATTINDRVKAIEYLREARARLSSTDTNYTTILERLNAEIKRLDAANRDAVASSKNYGTSVESLTKTHSRLLDTAGQLKRAFALIFSVSQIRNYISSIAQVRGEFELQQRSLQALLGDTRAANAIFNKTVALAVQSPYQIKDLV